jgi:hypothetical protein
MKKFVMILAAAVTTCVLLGLVSDTLAADPNKPKKMARNKELPVVGTVIVVKDNDGNATDVKIKTDKDIIYQVTLDDKGKELGRTMADKKVRVVGTLETKGEVKWLTVARFNEQKEKAKAEPNSPPAHKKKSPKRQNDPNQSS